MKPQQEIFETGEKENKNEIIEIEEEESIIEAPEPPAKFTKQKKKRAPLSEEQKERLKLQLAKGRATSLANRQKKAQLKKIEKEEQVSAQEDKIYQAISKKKNQTKDQDTLLTEIEDLKRKLAEKDEPKPPAVKEKKPRKPRAYKNTASTEAVEIKKPEPAPEPEPEPEPEPQPSMSNRNLAKMMRGLR